jgi:hypothetical protein
MKEPVEVQLLQDSQTSAKFRASSDVEITSSSASSEVTTVPEDCPLPYWHPEPILDKEFRVPYASFGPRKKVRP